MRKTITLVALLFCSATFAQEINHFNQYSVEGSYGFNYSRNPVLNGFNHFDIGLRYMGNEYWGAKADYGYDMFKSDDSRNANTTLNRVSLQAVYNIGRAFRVSDVAARTFNMLVHAGGGPTILKTEEGETDKGGHIIIGGTAQFYLSPNIALTGDLSGVLNFSQNYRVNGLGPYDSFTGKYATISVGLTWYFGKNGSTADWR
jgi:Outer membrane protein beta-barrel domain